jgi:hypothetical protein
MITRAITRAYNIMSERNWDTIYYCVDLHDTVFISKYDGIPNEFMPGAKEALQYISSLPESRIILWSSVKEDDKQAYIDVLTENDIKVHYFNSNPEVGDTEVGGFSEKFYFSVLIDDKAGFKADPDWGFIVKEIKRAKNEIG